jgi:hypothetical protein
VPYPNTTFARDLTNGTRTILICGTMVAQKDKSFFSTSTGNEPATQSFAKGINTGVIKGKAYFTSWSMNVMVEGLNVARHQDLMTHNHASPGGNSPAHPFIDDGTAKGYCKKDLEKIEKACAPEKKDDDKNTANMQRARKNFISQLKVRLQKIKQKFDDRTTGKGGTKSADNAWMEHCDGLWLKPSSASADEFIKELNNIKTDLESVVNSIVKPIVEKIEREVLEKLGKAAAEQLAKLGVRSGIRWTVGAGGAAIGGIGALVTEAIATIWNAYDLVTTAYDIYQVRKEILASVEIIKKVEAEFKGALDSLRKIEEDLSDPKKRRAVMAEVMSVVATLNDCTRARRCKLVRYEDTTAPALSLRGHGCCPGQTGHHIIPHEMTKDGNCPGYDKKDAPTICVEGTGNYQGTHGRIFSVLNTLIKDYNEGVFLLTPKGTISYTDARAMAVKSVRTAFVESGCGKKCLAAQLDDYYKRKCTKNMPAVSGAPGRKAKKGVPDDNQATDE